MYFCCYIFCIMMVRDMYVNNKLEFLIVIVWGWGGIDDGVE